MSSVYDYGLAKTEGGEWREWPSLINPSDMLQRLSKKSNLRMGGLVEFHPGMIVHAVRFPDGRVWDATLRLFRCDFEKMSKKDAKAHMERVEPLTPGVLEAGRGF